MNYQHDLKQFYERSRQRVPSVELSQSETPQIKGTKTMKFFKSKKFMITVFALVLGAGTATALSPQFRALWLDFGNDPEDLALDVRKQLQARGISAWTKAKKGGWLEIHPQSAHDTSKVLEALSGLTVVSEDGKRVQVPAKDMQQVIEHLKNWQSQDGTITIGSSQGQISGMLDSAVVIANGELGNHTLPGDPEALRKALVERGMEKAKIDEIVANVEKARAAGHDDAAVRVVTKIVVSGEEKALDNPSDLVALSKEIQPEPGANKSELESNSKDETTEAGCNAGASGGFVALLLGLFLARRFH